MPKLTPAEPRERFNWTPIFESLARDTPNQWMRVDDHGMVHSSLNGFAHKIRRGTYAQSRRVADKHDGEFDAVIENWELFLRFVPN